MATLALKDAGIEVIAVGNGEAAVRKMAEVSPDLVLADIFMPVRNGYELCEFIKRDPKYSNIPVLLLAGAFDPFDEREAQRVQADGILKKPFVPPDPLINAVKTLLEKFAGEKLMAVTVPVAAETSAETSASKAAPAASVAAAKPTAPPTEDEEAEAFDQPFSIVDLATGPNKEKTSFASSLSVQTPEMDEPEPVVTAARDPVLGEPTFWVPEELGRAQEAAEESVEESAEDLTDHTWNGSGHAAPMRDDPDPPMMLELEVPKPALEPVKPVPAAGPAVHHVDLSDFASLLAEPAKTVEEAETKHVKESAAPTLESFESFFAPSPVPAAPSLSSSSAAAISAPPIAFSVPPVPPEPEKQAKATSVEDTLPLPEAVVQSATLEMAPPKNSLQAPEVELPDFAESEATTPKLSEAPPVPEAPSIPEVSPKAASTTVSMEPSAIEPPLIERAVVQPAASEPAPMDAAVGKPALIEPALIEGEESLFELEDTVSTFPEFAAAPPISREPEQHPKPTVLHAAAEAEVADDWPPVFVPVTAPGSNQMQKPVFEIKSSAAASVFPSVSTLSAPVPGAAEAQNPAIEAAALSPAQPSVPAPPAALAIQREATAELAPELASLTSLSPEAQEAVIQRVIERMQPQIVELVTRQILRPLVESLVRDELSQK